MSDYRLEGLWFHVHVFVKLRKEEKSIAEKLKLVTEQISTQIGRNVRPVVLYQICEIDKGHISAMNLH